MQAANTRMTIVAILGTVQTTAATLTSTLDAAQSAVGMLNKTVTDAANRQKIRSTLDMAIFEKTLHQEKAQQLAQSRLDMQAFMATSQDHQVQYDAAFAELGPLLK